MSSKKKIYAVACAVMAVDLRHAARRLGMDVEFRFLEAGLHDRPNLLREKLQAAVDQINAAGDAARIVIGYGICGRGTVGVQAGEVPMAIPRVHDCIALFLGGDAAYRREFQKAPGTYYISAGWYEEKTEPISQRRRWASYGADRLHYDELVQTYGADAADRTFRFLNSWQRNYQRAVFIETGAKRSAKYEQYAREMAREYGWDYERVEGDHALIESLLTARESTDEILVVPPGHVIAFDALRSGLTANPAWAERRPEGSAEAVMVVDDAPAGPHSKTGAGAMKIGLGIDAGGTYTDAVVYDIADGKTLSKSKALTTKWDFTRGIGEALAGLDRGMLQSVEMVALSTTLATNAIVEGEGQKVGMILMPPYGLFDRKDIAYESKAVVAGALEISGQERTPVDPDEVRRTVRRMVDRDQVRAFAVSGFAGSINPAHELAVKQIIREETGLFVTCGHELSDILDFKVRANTAMLNARIIPRLAKLLVDLEAELSRFRIHAPVVVVKGDGTLMSAEMAKERPVETILSGPAASVAGARHLTGLADALVVDMGGTTTDTAALAGGAVSVCGSGSNVGGHMTHVKALEIRTRGLGGDSLIQLEKDEVVIGPRRVAPMAWLGARHPGAERAVDYLEARMQRYTTSTRGMQVLALNGTPREMDLTSSERELVELLASRPFSIDELLERTGVMIERALPLQRLEEFAVVQRCGLTPTDLLHATGRFDRWDARTAARYTAIYAALDRKDPAEMAEDLLEKVVRDLALELLKRELDHDTDPDAVHTCPVCRTLVENMFVGGSDHYRVRIDLKRPVVGIGAPIHYFLPRAAAALGAEAVLPPDADVANAIGAITSDVVVKRHVRIIPDQAGGFLIEGVSGTRRFRQFEEADEYARDRLVAMVRDQAALSGTSARRVELVTEDQIPRAAGGAEIFIGRVISATLVGRPDRVLKGA
mgnify:CR=1 FL=1